MKLNKEILIDTRIKEILKDSEINIHNKIVVLICSKDINANLLLGFQKKIHEEKGIMYFLEGSDSFTIITQNKYLIEFKSKISHNLIKTNIELVLVHFKSSPDVEKTLGIVSYLSSLFAENGVNIVEFISCWKDTIFIISKDDVSKAIEFLDF